jgi:hypothetical protein
MSRSCVFELVPYNDIAETHADLVAMVEDAAADLGVDVAEVYVNDNGNSEFRCISSKDALEALMEKVYSDDPYDWYDAMEPE